jgi:hypothetical protein
MCTNVEFINIYKQCEVFVIDAQLALAHILNENTTTPIFAMSSIPHLLELFKINSAVKMYTTAWFL